MSSPFTQHSRAQSISGQPSSDLPSGAGARRPSAYQQSHLRRGSAIPSHLLSDNSSPSPPSSSGINNSYGQGPSAYGAPSNNSQGGGGSRRASSGHARRGSVIDIAADMLAGQAGVESLEKARKVTDKVEDTLEQAVKPIRPWLPGMGRFLIVVTFLEDALRILTQLSGELFPSLPFSLMTY